MQPIQLTLALVRPVRFELVGLPRKSCLSNFISMQATINNKTWQVSIKILRTKLHVHVRDSILIGSHKTCQVWTMWLATKGFPTGFYVQTSNSINIGLIETWQVSMEVLRTKLYIHATDSILIGSGKTCQVWTGWLATKGLPIEFYIHAGDN